MLNFENFFLVSFFFFLSVIECHVIKICVLPFFRTYYYLLFILLLFSFDWCPLATLPAPQISLLGEVTIAQIMCRAFP